LLFVLSFAIGRSFALPPASPIHASMKESQERDSLLPNPTAEPALSRATANRVPPDTIAIIPSVMVLSLCRLAHHRKARFPSSIRACRGNLSVLIAPSYQRQGHKFASPTENRHSRKNPSPRRKAGVRRASALFPHHLRARRVDFSNALSAKSGGPKRKGMFFLLPFHNGNGIKIWYG
jgi:hypothetical protein